VYLFTVSIAADAVFPTICDADGSPQCLAGRSDSVFAGDFNTVNSYLPTLRRCSVPWLVAHARLPGE
jgi:hypothetical protein